MFTYFWETGRDRVWAGEGQRERETQNLKRLQALSAQSPTQGSNSQLTSLEIMTWAEVGSLTNWAIQVPQCLFPTTAEQLAVNIFVD